MGYAEWGTRLALHNSQPGAGVVRAPPSRAGAGASRRRTNHEDGVAVILVLLAGVQAAETRLRSVETFGGAARGQRGVLQW